MYIGASRQSLDRISKRCHLQISLSFAASARNSSFSPIIHQPRLILSSLVLAGTPVHAETAPPNILIVLTDDVGLLNIGAYHRGLMSSRTPNIDRIAKEGMLFTDYYAQPTCTAGRSAMITGQFPVRTGLHSVGLPGDPLGLRPETPTLPELLKDLGYRTGQFGKNHLGDRDEFLPTMHGFDEFWGWLYHLNAMEYTFDPEVPKGEEAARACKRWS